MSESLRVGLLFGGRSPEHEVSVRSARNVRRALGEAGHTVVPLRISRAGRWTVEPDGDLADEPGAGGAGRPLLFAADATGRLLAEGAGGALDPVEVDVVFPMLHGVNGEDGRVQGLLQTLGLPYVGPDVLASAVCMDKDAAKRLLAAAGVPVAASVTVRAGRPAPSFADLAGRLGPMLFVKPAGSGSSVGVAKVEAEDGLRPALDAAFRYDRKALVEEAVVGREIEVAVLGNEEPRASVPGEIVSTAAFYDYEAKYVDAAAARMEVPADLAPDVAERVRALAVEAYAALGCEGLARVDFFVADDGRVLVNEVNTIPGFTERSMYPVMWERTGLAPPALADRLVRLALERHRRDAALVTTWGGG
ncbi:D-alanine--D-alanine ligase family protein [Rubrivirga sp. S365]|uniref:D-alanine--D-alanine ligase n=1 Tax=Rubrivirga litoralis TaxID=3075598 RepID=A0ABU3BLV3_9BACT|nr:MULTISPECIES: D-alanine--D-alanine ligase family protein [unclassified Rubrivirga]MDT0630274.1 D-alanine--D-alanine ligase family protein [Rubrivirga sp. F394]MDT7855786.1 D-alanine--D-alanine ligase family protein [Rubrivirga sp. S365]